jgi:hypothetical protein
MSQQNINTSFPNDGLGDALRDAFNKTEANFTELFSNKVDKVPGKDLSDNNLTDDLLQKINDIDDDAAENVQSDWAQNDNAEDDYIKNKPTLVSAFAPSKVNISFDFPVNSKTELDSLHGTYLRNDSEDGIILNSGTPIVGDGGLSKVMFSVLAGSVLTGEVIITGTSIDTETAVETPGDTETIPVDGLSIDNSTTDSNGNNVHAFIDNYISAKFWTGTLTFSTPDLDLTEIRFGQCAFEQFDAVEDLTINSLSATYQISNTASIMDAYLYAVEVIGSKASLTKIAEIHHGTGEITDSVFKRRQGALDKQLDGTTDGVFIDMFLAPTNQEYFNNFTIKVWATILSPMSLFIDNSAMNESIVYGETLTAGEIAYLALDGKYYIADNTDVLTSTTQLRLITVSGILDDEKLALKEGKYTTSGLTAGNEYLGVSGGVLIEAPTDPAHIVRILSTAISTNARYFNPSATWLLGDGSSINGVDINPTGLTTIADAWSVGGLDVRAYATNAPILDQFYTGAAQTITVNPAPVTPGDLRYIAIVMDVNGIITAQDGAEGAAVLPPGVDTDNYYLIRYLLISFGDTSPTDEDGNGVVEFDVLYKEFGTEAGGESDVTTTDGTIVVNTAGSPFGGVGIRGLNVPSNGTRKVDFTHTTKRNFSDLTGLYFNFSLDEVVKRTRLYVQFYNESVRVARISIRNGQHGFSDRTTNGQNIGVPKEFLSIIDTQYDRVRIYVGAPVVAPIAGFWLDDVLLNNAFNSNPNTPEPVQLQSDWDQTDNTTADYIKNKPTIPAAQVQSDWDQTDNGETDFIKNKPAVGAGDMILAAVQTVTGLKTFRDLKLGLRNVAETFTSFFTNVNTASRTYTLQDKSGTVAHLDDITGGGGILSFGYESDTSGDTSPASGKITWNNATQINATKLYVSFTDRNGTDIKAIVQEVVNVGDNLFLQERTNSNNFQKWEITGSTDQGTYSEVDVVLVSGAAQYGNQLQLQLTVGSAAGGVTADSVGLAEVKDIFKKVLTDATAGGAQTIDWEAYSGFIFTLTSAITFTDDNLPAAPNETQISFLMTGEETFTPPSYWKFGGDDYDGTVWNYFAIECKDNTGAAEQVVCIITNLS